MGFMEVVSFIFSREFLAVVAILAPIIGAFISLYQSRYFFKLQRRKLSTQDYMSAKELIKEIDNQSHPFVIEKAYQAVSGDSSLSAEGIIYLLSLDRKSTRLNSSHVRISYAVFCLKK